MDNHHHIHSSQTRTRTRETRAPHVLFFPLPLQGPVNCFLKLAELFCLRRLKVTFLNSDHIHRRLLSLTDISTRFQTYDGLFTFRTISDGLPEDSPRTGEQIGELLDSMEAVSLPVFREMVRCSNAAVHGGDVGGDEENLPFSCIIADGAFGFAAEVAGEFGVPLLYFDTISPCGLWPLVCANRLVEAGEFPFKDDDMDATLSSVPAMEGFLRRRDLPSFFRINDLNNPLVERILNEEKHMKLAQGLIFNTFHGLEAPVLSHFQTFAPKVYAIGPLHTHHKTRLAGVDSGVDVDHVTSTNSIWKENRDCISWLGKQPVKSVVYVSIGSLAVMGKEQFVEIWHGLVNSRARFLWVQRPGSITGSGEDMDRDLQGLNQATKERGYIVSWAPQEEVLGHPAVGAFLTHSGWNSTLESMVEGVPMICWPYFADQQINSRFVGEVWKLGLDMKDTCDRGIVEMMVREIMDDDVLQMRVMEMANLAKESVNSGGSSYNDLNRLIQDIKLMTL